MFVEMVRNHEDDDDNKYEDDEDDDDDDDDDDHSVYVNYEIYVWYIYGYVLITTILNSLYHDYLSHNHFHHQHH